MRAEPCGDSIYLSTVLVEYQGFDIIGVSFEFHHFGTWSRVPYSQDSLCGPANNDSSGGIHGQAVYWVLVAIKTRCGHSIVASCQCRKRIDVPKKNGLVQTSRGNLVTKKTWIIMFPLMQYVLFLPARGLWHTPKPWRNLYVSEGLTYKSLCEHSILWQLYRNSPK